MQVIKFANIETAFTSRITKKYKIKIIQYDDGVYVVVFRKYFSDEEECSLSFSDSYVELEKAQNKFDFYVKLATR